MHVADYSFKTCTASLTWLHVVNCSLKPAPLHSRTLNLSSSLSCSSIDLKSSFYHLWRLWRGFSEQFPVSFRAQITPTVSFSSCSVLYFIFSNFFLLSSSFSFFAFCYFVFHLFCSSFKCPFLTCYFFFFYFFFVFNVFSMPCFCCLVRLINVMLWFLLFCSLHY